jgi:flagellar biosynthesis protein FlhF
MKLKRYIASDMKEALQAVRAELGPEAVIIHSQEQRAKGLSRLWRRAKVEVLAALEEDQPLRGSAPAAPSRADEDRLKQIEQRLESISRSLRAPAPASREPARPSPGAGLGHERLPASLDFVRSQGLSDELLAMLGEMPPAQRDGPGLAASLRRLLPPCSRLTLRGDQPDVIFFLGPTGVGKTTTLAKVAAELALQHGRRVGLITVDTYRVAAVPQIDIYANLLGVPMRVAYSPAELVQAVGEYAGFDAVLVDTPGRSPADSDGLGELEQYIAAVPGGRTVLLLDAGAHVANLRTVARSFQAERSDGVILTKLDETKVYGPMYSIAAEIGKPILYLTIGQNVPQDIEPATADRLVALLTGNVPERADGPSGGIAREFTMLAGHEISNGMAGGKAW